MELSEINMIRACIDLEKKPFYYHKGRYALELLRWQLPPEGEKINVLRKGPAAALLNKPIAQELLRQCGDGILRPSDIQGYWPEKPEVFRLGFSQWNGTYHRWEYSSRQCSRSGYSLVLQLNFGAEHMRWYQQVLKPKEDFDPFSMIYHPVETESSKSLAWARLDIDLDNGEALIEEIQTDWLRMVDWQLGYMEEHMGGKPNADAQDMLESSGANLTRLKRYRQSMQQHYKNLWDEAMLCAALWLLREELGIRNVYYHTYDTGNLIKQLRYKNRTPPRSLYTRLPRAFAFQEGAEAPRFLAQDKLLRRFWELDEPKRWFKAPLNPAS